MGTWGDGRDSSLPSTHSPHPYHLRIPQPTLGQQRGNEGEQGRGKGRRQEVRETAEREEERLGSRGSFDRDMTQRRQDMPQGRDAFDIDVDLEEFYGKHRNTSFSDPLQQLVSARHDVGDGDGGGGGEYLYVEDGGGRGGYRPPVPQFYDYDAPGLTGVVCVGVCECVCVCVDMCIYVYTEHIFICIYMYIDTCIHTYIYIFI